MTLLRSSSGSTATPSTCSTTSRKDVWPLGSATVHMHAEECAGVFLFPAERFFSQIDRQIHLESTSLLILRNHLKINSLYHGENPLPRQTFT